MIVSIGNFKNEFDSIFREFCSYTSFRNISWLTSHNLTWANFVSSLFSKLKTMGISYDEWSDNSWFQNRCMQTSVVWHKDGGAPYTLNITAAWPTSTKFIVSKEESKILGLKNRLYIPPVGEVVISNLKERYHRTPPQSVGQPRICLRISIFKPHSYSYELDKYNLTGILPRYKR